MVDTSSYNAIAGLSGTMLGLTTISVVLRFYARRRQKTTWLADDWLVAVAWLVMLGLLSLIFYGISERFIGYPTPHDKKAIAAIHPIMLKVYWSLNVVAVPLFGTVKLSALFFYRRVFCSGRNDAFNIITIITIVIVSLWTAVYIVWLMRLCGPNIEDEFNPSIVCPGKFDLLLSVTISDFILDIFVLALPVHKIWLLHMRVQRKIGITAIFLLALVGIAASCARMVNSIQNTHAGEAYNQAHLFDINTAWAYFNVLEAGLTILAVNLPSLYYFVAGVTPQSVLNSVRSLVSLRSPRKSEDLSGYPNKGFSKDSGLSKDSHGDVESSAGLSGAQFESLSHPEGRSIATTAAADHPATRISRGDGTATKMDGIHVNSRIERTEE